MRKTTIIVLIVILLMGALGGAVAYFAARSTPKVRAFSLQRFVSADDFMEAFKNGLTQYNFSEEKMSITPMAAGDAAEGTPEHSTTNVQVEGVDEADIVKNDGRYIYAIAGSRVFIVEAYPAGGARVVSRIDFDEAASLNELFLADDALVVIGSGGNSATPEPSIGEEHPYPRGGSTFMEVYDVSNREKPLRVRAVEYEGDYSTAFFVSGFSVIALTA